MTAHGARRGNLIYHWKHGWIPLDHFAALSKAHHSRAGAVKVMHKHGIEVPHGYMGAGHHGAPKVSHGAFDKKINEDLRAKHLEAVRSGDSATAARHAATLRANAAERDGFRRQMDAKYAGQGRPFMRQVYGVDPAAMNNEDLSRFHHSLQAEDDRALVDTGRKLRDLTAGEHSARGLGRGSAAPKAPEMRAKVRDLPAGDGFKGVHSETHMGEKVTVRKGAEWGTIQSEINGHVVSTGFGRTNADAVRHLDSTKATIEHAKANPANYTNGLGETSYGMKLNKPDAPAPKDEARVTVEHSGDGTILHFGRDDLQAREAAKSVGARWSRNLGAWYLPRTQTESTRRYKVAQLQSKLGDSVHVVDSGHGKTSTAAEREAERKAASAARAERLDARAAKLTAERDARFKRADEISQRRPFGQPILVGHYSERGARADQRRIETNMDKGVEAGAKAAYTQRIADAARKNATGTDSPLLRQRRIDRNEAEIRKIDREIAAHKAALDRSGQSHNTAYMSSLAARRAELADQVAHDKSQIEASGFKGVDPSQVQAGDMIQYRGRTHIVTKVNKTTFSVPTPYSWEDKVPINQVTKHIPLSTQSDGALESAYRNAKNPKVKGAIAREMKKRGLTLPAE